MSSKHSWADLGFKVMGRAHRTVLSLSGKRVLELGLRDARG